MHVEKKMRDLLGGVLLHTVVDVAQSSPCQNVGCLLIDQRVKMSLDLENVRESVAEYRVKGCIVI